MKLILLFFSSVICLSCFGQNWISFSKTDFFKVTPTNQFIIDPFTNDIWFVSDSKASTVHTNGQVFEFGTNELGALWAGDNLCFGFSQGHIYFSKLLEGLYSFDSYNRSLKFSSTKIDCITTNSDTVYTMSGTQNMYKYTPVSTIDAMYGLSNVIAKNQFLYFNSGVIGRKVGLGSVYLHMDPQYLIAPINDFKFTRKTDTLYVAGTKGISYAYNYDFLDTITPNNTLNMPSSNVLEIEFDHLDGLWAVFGDGNDVPFALAKLEGNAWTNVFDGSNSPIDFTNFLGLEIDTLGNVWVVDNVQLHTLLTPNSPSWLTTYELEKPSSIFSVYPNPSHGTMHLTINPNTTVSTIEITDLSGKLLSSMACTSELELNLERGQYFICLKDGELTLEVEKIVIE
jgi:hypothetical protein